MSPGIVMLNTKVLMLNRSFVPIHVTSVRRAFNLLYLGIARVVNERYQTYDFQSWRDLAVTLHDESIGLVDQPIRVPRVIVLLSYDRVPRRQVRFSRYNIYVRDKCTCQYCGRRDTQLTVDHILPKHLGGEHTWTNVVAACPSCNHRKGGRRLDEVHMNLLHTPVEPPASPIYLYGRHLGDNGEWEPFIIGW